MGDKQIRILLVEDDKVDQMAFGRFVREEQLPYEFTIAGSLAQSAELIAAQEFDLIISDYMLGDGTLFDLFDKVKGIPIIVTTGAGDEETAVSAMKSGAWDYLVKDPKGHYLRTLPFTVESVTRRIEAEKELVTYREQLESMVRERTAELESEIAVRQEAEMALRKSNEHLVSLLENATDFVIYRLAYDETEPSLLRIDFVSPSILDVLDLASEEITLNSFYRHIHPEDLERVTVANEKALKTNRFDQIFRFHHAGKGEWVWVHAISTGVRDEGGALTHVNGIMVDITAKQNAEETLKIKAQSLEETNTALNVLLKKRAQDKITLEENVAANISSLILPPLEKLLNSNLNTSQKDCAEIILSNIKEVVSGFSIRMSSQFFRLSPAEIQVANFIKHGKRTKEIAAILNISTKTVKNHRQKIREKMGIKNKKINLVTYLLSR